ncbi:MAG TPA: hypothetical protein VGL42_18260 [Opitutaceae bacterium]|jgi:hypothetical protein
MTLPIPSFCPTGFEASASSRKVAFGEASWNRWIFKAPPLRIDPPEVDLRELFTEWAPKPVSR